MDELEYEEVHSGSRLYCDSYREMLVSPGSYDQQHTTYGIIASTETLFGTIVHYGYALRHKCVNQCVPVMSLIQSIPKTRRFALIIGVTKTHAKLIGSLENPAHRGLSWFSRKFPRTDTSLYNCLELSKFWMRPLMLEGPGILNAFTIE